MAKDDRKARILERAAREKVKFMRLQFTDLLGAVKNVEVPDRQFEEALEGGILTTCPSKASCASKNRTCT